jgi:predicted nucleotide-binding protein
MSTPSSNASSSGRVAVVGRLDEAASEATGFIEQFGLDAVVLQNVASGSDGGLIERLDSLREVAFAVVLLSEADRLHLDILLEVGFLFGSLGRSKICFILTGGAALPGELGGVMNYPMDENGLWKLLLAREMRRAGLDVDLNRAL